MFCPLLHPYAHKTTPDFHALLTDGSSAADARVVHIRALATVDCFVHRVLHVANNQSAGRTQAVRTRGLPTSVRGTESEG